MKAGRRGRVLWWAAGALLAVVVAAGAIVVEARAWRDSLVGEGRALTGTTVAGRHVGAHAGGEVREVAGQAAEALLDRRVTVEHGGERWHVTPRMLGATTDAGEVARAALEATASAPLHRVAGVRWLGRGFAFDREVRLRAAHEEVAHLVATIARDVDRDPVDAAVAWDGGDVALQAGEAGVRVDREAAVADVTAALEGSGGRVVALAVTHTEPRRTAAELEPELPALREAVAAALDRALVVRHGDRQWEVTPRELGAVPDPLPLVDAVLGAEPGAAVTAAGDTGASGATAQPYLGVPLDVPDSAVGKLVAAIAGEVDRDPRDAVVDHASGWVDLIPDEPGVTVDRDAARERLRAALAGGEDVVELPVDAVEAEVTAGDFHHVLLVRQDQRRLYLYVDGEIAREWPVAIGAPGSATPTGTFTVGAMRHSPTWYNPAPEGWGADMPEVVEPGPTNPLGLRAINWVRGGRDSLIRFHGTAETSSIGQAASRGCVRMTNGDVVELFDLVEPGTTIVSTWG